MRFIFLLVLFLNCIFAKSYVLQNTIQKGSLVKYTKYLSVPITNKITPQEVVKSNKLAELDSSDIEFNPNNSVWTVSEIKNDSNVSQVIYMVNFLVLTEKINVYIFEDNKLKEEHKVGFTTTDSKDMLYSTFPAFKLELKQKTSYKIVTQITNTTGRIDPKWTVMSESYFQKFLFQNYSFWGFILGAMLLVLLMHIFLNISLKINGYKSYLAYVIMLWIYFFANNGFAMLMFGTGMYNSYLVHIAGYTPFVFYVLFLDEYLGLSKRDEYKTIIKFMYAYSNYLAFSSFVIIFSNILYSYDNYHFALSAILVILVLVITFRESYKSRVIPKFYLFGQISLLIAFLSANLINVSVANAEICAQQFPGIFELIEVVLFAIAIFLNIYQAAKRKETTEKLMLSQSHFSTIGQTLRNIAHQWKVPSVRLGTLITELESIFYSTHFSNKRASEILIHMRNNANFMKDTITDFSTFYTSEKSGKSVFIPANEINDIRLLLIEKMNHINFTINCDENLSNFTLNCDARTFVHVSMIIIDNAIDIAKNRNIKNPYINISAKKELGQIIISFVDNCGGIRQQPIESIFELNVTTHNDSSRGIGLAMAKMLVESKLNAKISVNNEGSGAKFDILFIS